MQRFTVQADIFDPEANLSASISLTLNATNEEAAEFSAWDILDHIPANIEITDIFPLPEISFNLEPKP